MSAIRTPSPPPKRSQNVTVPGATGAPVIPAPSVLHPLRARPPAPSRDACRKVRRESDEAAAPPPFVLPDLLTDPTFLSAEAVSSGSARPAGGGLCGQVRPAPAIPADRADAEPEVAAPGGVVVVVREIRAVHRLTPRAHHRAVFGEDHGAAAVQERSPELVVVRPGDGAGAANGDLVRALEPSAAEVERDEQVVVPATAHDVGSLDGVGWHVPVREPQRLALPPGRLGRGPPAGQHT